MLLWLVNAFVNGPGSLVRTPVGFISHFVPGMAIVCATGLPIYRLQPRLHQRHWEVPCRQVQVVLLIFLRPRTVEFVQVPFTFSVMYMYRVVSLRLVFYRRTPDCGKDLHQYSGMPSPELGVVGLNPYRCSLHQYPR